MLWCTMVELYEYLSNIIEISMQQYRPVRRYLYNKLKSTTNCRMMPNILFLFEKENCWKIQPLIPDTYRKMEYSGSFEQKSMNYIHKIAYQLAVENNSKHFFLKEENLIQNGNPPCEHMFVWCQIAVPILTLNIKLRIEW